MWRVFDCIKHLKILLVENDVMCGEIIKKTFMKYCLSFEWAKDGKDGLEMYHQQKFDLIICDIILPRLNGFDMLEEILYENPNQDFIIITSYDTDINLIKSLKMKAFFYFRKPIDMRDLQIILVNYALNNQKPTQFDYLENGIKLDMINERIYKNDQEVFLSPKLKKFFWFLMQNANQVVAYESIISYVYDNEASLNTLRMAIVRIKKFLESEDIITNVSGAGYLLKINKTKPNTHNKLA